MAVRSGNTPHIKYDYDKQTMQVRSSDEMTFKNAKRMMREIEEILAREHPAPNPSAPDDLSLSKAPWILRKLFGWQDVIKKA